MINGILNIYKEKGYTSHDVVARLRGILKQKKIGHTGTLDPEAEGVLPVCLGRATKVCGLLTDKDKTYRTVLLLGKTTDTQDLTGSVICEKDTSMLTRENVKQCILSFTGEYDQIPPMYSALKIGGKKLYELAREGKTVERKSRRVSIYEIRILKMELPRVEMEISCSKGTYIRTLCNDIGDRLGTGGCMECLLRTKAGPFLLENSIRLSEVERIFQEGRLDSVLVPLDRVFSSYKQIILKEEALIPGYNGNPLEQRHVEGPDGLPVCGESYRLYDPDGHFVGIYEYDGKKFRLIKMFLDPEELK